MKEIAAIAASTSPVPSKSSSRWRRLGTTPPFSEKLTPQVIVSMEAAGHNATLLREVDYDFQHFFQGQAGSTLSFGSEFRPATEQLCPLLRHHPGFEELTEVLVSGMPTAAPPSLVKQRARTKS
jgi:hypothetical protein